MALVALVTSAVGVSITLLLTASSARDRLVSTDARHVHAAASPLDRPAATAVARSSTTTTGTWQLAAQRGEYGSRPLEVGWRERLRLARAARCARAVPGVPIGCERVTDGEIVQKLTEPLVRSVADEHGLVFVAFANAKYADFATSWVSNLARANVTCLLLGAMDRAALDVFDALDVASFMMSTPKALLAHPTIRAEPGQGQTEYLKLGSFKTSLIAQIVQYGVDVLLSDVDNIFMRDPRPVFARYPEADVLATADLLSTTRTNGGLELGGEARKASLNVGLVLLRSSARALVAEWAEHMIRHPMHWDQVLQAVFDQMAKRRGGTSTATRSGGELWPCYSGLLWCGVLPVSTFCGGHQFNAEGLPFKLGLEPYALHTTYINSMDEGKRHRLREAMLFEDAPAYYDVQPGVLTYQPDIPARLYTPRPFSLSRPPRLPQFTIAEHFALVHHQLAQLRDAYALANATGRLLVLPRLVCGLDRFFYRHDGVSPGSSMNLPIWNCPADMVLALQLGIKPTPEAHVREWSFLRNPRLPAEMRRADATYEVAIELPSGGGSGDGGGNGDGDVGAQGRQAARAAVLAAVGSAEARRARVLRLLARPPDAQRWMGEEEYGAFERTLSRWGDFWCCAPIESELPPEMLERVLRSNELGLKAKTHIHYDMFADKVPHTDRWGREWKTAWRPISGEKWNLTDALNEPWRSMIVFGRAPGERR